MITGDTLIGVVLVLCLVFLIFIAVKRVKKKASSEGKKKKTFTWFQWLIITYLTFLSFLQWMITGDGSPMIVSFLEALGSLLTFSLIVWLLGKLTTLIVSKIGIKNETLIKTWKITKIVITCLIGLWFLIFFFGSASLDSTIPVNCEYPKMMIGDECCVPNTDFGIPVCLSEAEKMNEQLNNAVENDILTKEQEETILSKFTLLIPEDYYAIRNVKAGYFDIPLFLISYGENGETMMIRVMYSESSDYDSSIEEFYDGFKEGLDKSAPNAKYSEPEFLQNNKNGFEIALFNMTANIADTTTFSSQALIKSGNEILIISYLSDDKDLFDYYYYEFDNMVWSVDKS